MRIILALICFIAMFMHAFFGYYLYVRGESVFEPDNMIVAVQKKVAVNTNKLSIFQKKSDHIDDPVVKEYLAEKLKSASWLINNLVRRKRTIINCAHAIISRQSEFFESKGTAPLSPLTQRELAESLNVNASTICRIVNSKYIQCPFGTYPLSHFFCTAVRTDNGSVSASHIKQRIEAIVKAEAAGDPLSDQRITELLSKENIKVSRRTVAKYRLEMDIPDRAERRNRYKLTAT